MSRRIQVPFHIQIEPTFGTSAGVTTVTSARAVAITQDKPEVQQPGTLLVKLTVEVDELHLLQAGGVR